MILSRRLPCRRCLAAHAPSHRVGDRAAEAALKVGFRRGHISRQDILELRMQIQELVLNGCATQRHPNGPHMLCHCFHSFADQSVVVLDLLCLIQQHPPECIRYTQGFDTAAEGAVGRQEDVGGLLRHTRLGSLLLHVEFLRILLAIQTPALGWRRLHGGGRGHVRQHLALGTNVDVEPEFIARPSLQLLLPGAQQAFGHHHQHGFVEHAVLLHVQHHGNRLQGLSKAHVVGQNAAQTIPGVVHEPMITGKLVRPQHIFQLFRGWHLLNADQADLRSLVELLHRSIQDHSGLCPHGGLEECKGMHRLRPGCVLLLVLQDLLRRLSGQGEVGALAWLCPHTAVELLPFGRDDVGSRTSGGHHRSRHALHILQA
mmetsp:Transcript_43305/g.68616  ORF Transcript_43305/g.68616 Transcript_43305/m.68616 type:complete len:372 (-) Transcript_43305:1386-2501(-)